jgi:hypothetical protein
MVCKYANLVGLFAACLCRAASEYSRYAFGDASRQITKIHDDFSTLIYLEPVPKSGIFLRGIFCRQAFS